MTALSTLLGGARAFGRGYIDGLILSNGTDADHDINISIGECRDASNLYDLLNLATLTKQIDAAWSAGTGAGGLFSGTVGNATWYHVFLIRKDVDGTVDAGFDTSVTAANRPAGYTYYRRIGSVLTNGSANILAFTQNGNTFLWAALKADLDSVGSSPNTSTLITVSVPTGIVVDALVVAVASSATVSDWYSLQSADQSTNQYSLYAQVASVPNRGGQYPVRTNTSGQIRHIASDTDLSIYLRTGGWIDPRGSEGGFADGTQTILQMPRGYIDGLILANDTDADHDISVAQGIARDATDSVNLKLSAAMVKRIDAAWAAGTGNGGLDTGSVGNSTWYHLFLIMTVSGTVDVLFSTSATAPTMPAGYVYKRRIGSVLTDASANILAFYQTGDEFLWVTSLVAYTGAPPATDTDLILATPTGISVQALLALIVTETGAAIKYAAIKPLTGLSNNYLYQYATVTSYNRNGTIPIRTNTASKVQIIGNSTGCTVITGGWIDPRGKDA